MARRSLRGGQGGPRQGLCALFALQGRRRHPDAARAAIYAGCNVENAAYPVGSCAEAGAIAAMIAAGDTAIDEILVLGWTDANPDAPGLTTPCGGCRQRIREFAAGSTPVHVAGPDGLRRSFTLDALLPESFGPENLDGWTGRPISSPSR